MNTIPVIADGPVSVPGSSSSSSQNSDEPDAKSTTSTSGQEKDPNADVDPQILEALKSKDRLFVLRVGELMEGLITERRCVPCPNHPLSPSSCAPKSFPRLIVC